MKTLYILPALLLFIPLSLPAQSGGKETGRLRPAVNDSTISLSPDLSDTLIQKRPGKKDENPFIFRHQCPDFRPPGGSETFPDLRPPQGSEKFPHSRPPQDSDKFPHSRPPQGSEIFPPSLPQPGSEIYPGAPKFYGKSRTQPLPYEKSFVIPHRIPLNSKYHLIIKDPLTKRIIN
ncbi:MAG TPA: hypothetical protein PLM01_10445 [Bacteroidales bacterium]|jgi:hypothetical protein|nr:hypothetical protein [Bacteroidales bacterium]HQJ82917.1 hypothetical protein [Bacteroidales bacterium]